MNSKSVHRIFHGLFNQDSTDKSETTLSSLLTTEQDHVVFTDLKKTGLLHIQSDAVTVPLQNRLPLIQIGLQLGGDLEQLASYLTWQEFEAFCRTIADANLYRCHSNVRFTTQWNKKRYEIDVLAFRKPYILGIDAKHWQIRKGSVSALKTALKAQHDRLENLIKILPDKLLEFQINRWGKAILCPIIVSLFDQNIDIQSQGVIVPIFKLNSFLLGFEANLDMLPVLEIDLPIAKKLIDYF